MLEEKMDKLVEMLEQQQEYNKRQEEFNKALVEQLDQQRQYIDESINKRTEQVTLLLWESIENKKKWWQFWK